MQIEHNQNIHFGSLTRIADLQQTPFTIRAAPRAIWDAGDYVVGRYVGNKSKNCDFVELCDGSLEPLKPNDLVVGALGDRTATQEAVGTWKLIDGGSHPEMHHICCSGMFGIETSRSTRQHPSAKFIYEGHCLRLNKKICMKDYAPAKKTAEVPGCPMILVLGSSMSCGKTIAGKVCVQIAKKRLGFKKVAGVKFTGAGFHHDIHEFSNAGADVVFDFVDSGYCSTVMPPGEFREASLPAMLGLLADCNPDCVVAELGASPLEPYNGVEVLKKLLGSQSRVFICLCASDAYAALGLQKALVSEGLDFHPDVVCGIATNNSAAIALVERVSGVTAVNLADPNSVEALISLVKKKLID